MKKSILPLFLMITAGITAQVSGYMGKRVSLGYSNYLAPRLPILGVMEEIGIGDDYKITTTRWLNSTHCLDVDYVVASNASLCVSTQFSKMDFYEYGTEFYIEENDKGTSSYYNISYKPGDKSNMDLKTLNFSLGFKFFRSRYMNPFGKYRKIELILARSKVIMDEDAFYYESGSQSPYYTGTKYDLPRTKISYKSFVFAYTVGKQRILFNKLVLDYGVRFGINYNYVFNHASIIGMIKDDTSDELSIEQRLKEAANYRLFGSQLLNAHVGLRFLAF